MRRLPLPPMGLQRHHGHKSPRRARAELTEKVDFVFIDPPYAEPSLREQAFAALRAADRLNPGACLYFEWPVDESFELPSPELEWRRQKRAGRVNYAIAEWQRSR